MPCPLSNDTTAVTFKEIPNAEPLPVAIALTMEIAPCIVARTLFVIGVLQTIQREPFSLLPWEQLFLSRFQKLLLPVLPTFRIRRLFVLLQILHSQANSSSSVYILYHKQCYLSLCVRDR